MKKIKLELDIPDNWEPRYCQVCPLHYEETSYDGDWWTVCVLDSNYNDCPLRRAEYEKI